MINYIRSEVYRISQKRSLYIYYLAVTIGFIGLQLLAINSSSEAITPSTMREIALQCLLVYPIFLGIQIYLTVYNDDKNNGVMANVLTSGVSKSSYIIGKLIVQLIYLVISLIYLGLIYLVNYIVVLGGISTFNIADYSTHFVYIFILCLAMLAYSSVVTILFHTTKKGAMCVVAYVLLVTQTFGSLLVLVSSGLNLPISHFLENYTISGALGQVTQIYNETNIIEFKYIAALLVYIVVGVAVTQIILKNRDIIID